MTGHGKVTLDLRNTDEKVDYLIGEFATLKVLLDTMIAMIHKLEERVERIERSTQPNFIVD